MTAARVTLNVEFDVDAPAEAIRRLIDEANASIARNLTDDLGNGAWGGYEGAVIRGPVRCNGSARFD